jgi:hypothetical protein
VGAAAAAHTHLSEDVTDATSDATTNPGKLLKSDDDGYVRLSTIQLGVAGGGGDGSLQIHDAFGERVTINSATLTAGRTQTLPDKTGTLALTSDITETGAAINAATPIATMADNDRIAGTDTSASGIIGYITGTVLWTWIVTKLGALTSLTAGGAWAFSGSRPTCSAGGTPEATSLITRGDGDARYGNNIVATATINSTTLTPTTDTMADLTLPVGTYAINAYYSLTTTEASGTTTIITSFNIQSGTLAFSGEATVSPHQTSSPIVFSIRERNNLTQSIGITVGNPNYTWGSAKWSGYVVVTSAAVMRFMFTHGVAVTNPTTGKFFVVATKIA